MTIQTRTTVNHPHGDTRLGPVAARPRSGRWSRLLAGGLLGLTAAGCDVTNPGPVQDEFLNDAATHDGLVRGAERNLLRATMRIFFASATITREIFPGGDTNSHSPRLQAGALPSDEMNEYWDPLQQARFIAEDALARFENPDVEADPELVVQARIWAGYANKLLGENFCGVAFDGGPEEDPSVALERAEAHFTAALASPAATADQKSAAYAGRAQTRVELGDWTGALADAAQVPPEFVLEIDADPAIVETRNFIAWANANLNYRQYTYHFTYFYEYYPATGDPRVEWTTDPDFPVANASLSGFGNVPWSFDPTFPLDSPMRLSSGTEMLLYRAEGLLQEGQWQQAMELVNQVRSMFVSNTTDQPLEPLTASSAAEAGTHLKNERLINGFLQGRRLMDIRRWDGPDAETPGEYWWPDWESLTPIFGEEPMSRCFPIPDEEREINPNL